MTWIPPVCALCSSGVCQLGKKDHRVESVKAVITPVTTPLDMRVQTIHGLATMDPNTIGATYREMD